MQLAAQLKLAWPASILALNKHRFPEITLDTPLNPGTHLAIPTKMVASSMSAVGESFALSPSSRAKRPRQSAVAEARLAKKVRLVDLSYSRA